MTLGSQPPAPGFPVTPAGTSIQVDPKPVSGVPTNLLVSGVVGDRAAVAAGTGSAYILYKTGTGRLIFTASNTYMGGTDIEAGFMNVEDSQALGPTGATGVSLALPQATGPNVSAIVQAGATLELELQTDAKVAGSPIFGMPTPMALDSVTHASNEMTFPFTEGASIALFGTGVGGEGALDSISGINKWTTTIDLQGDRRHRRERRPQPGVDQRLLHA